MDKIHLAGPWITDVEMDMVADAMKNGWYENAYYYCEKFQKEIALYHDRKYALMTPNCTSAIHLLLLGLGITEGDEVLVPDCTWIASVAPVTYVNATPVFCDIDPEDWCISLESMRQNLTSKTKAVIVVDLYGNMPNYEKIEAFCKEHNLLLIEDSAESIGSTYKGKKAGSFGVGSVFSFHRTKTLTTGEGGMLLLDDEELFEKCVKLRDHGRGPKTPTYFNEMITPKYMPFNVQAALGYAQFTRLDELVGKKRDILKSYKTQLQDCSGLQLNPEPDHIENSAWISALVFSKSLNINKSDAIEKLAELGCPARPFFFPLTSVPAFQKFTGGKDYSSVNKNSYDISARGINLPGAMNLNDEQLNFIGDCVKKLVN